MKILPFIGGFDLGRVHDGSLFAFKEWWQDIRISAARKRAAQYVSSFHLARSTDNIPLFGIRWNMGERVSDGLGQHQATGVP
jgi:hypothetical protein